MKTLDEKLAELSPERRKKIEGRTKELQEEYFRQLELGKIILEEDKEVLKNLAKN